MPIDESPRLASSRPSRSERIMREALLILAFLAVWIFLQAWLLPKLGIRT